MLLRRTALLHSLTSTFKRISLLTERSTRTSGRRKQTSKSKNLKLSLNQISSYARHFQANSQTKKSHSLELRMPHPSHQIDFQRPWLSSQEEFILTLVRLTKVCLKDGSNLAEYSASYKVRLRCCSSFRDAKFSKRKGQAVAKAPNRANRPLFHARVGLTFALRSSLVPWTGTDDPWPRPQHRSPVWSARVSSMFRSVCPPITLYHLTRVIPVVLFCERNNRAAARNIELADRCDPASVDRNWSRNCSSCRKCRWASASILAPKARALAARSLTFLFVAVFSVSLGK